MKATLAALVALVVFDAQAHATLSITNEFGTPISDAYYDLTWNGDAATILILDRYPDTNGQNIWEVRGTGGEDIELLDVQVPDDQDVQTQIILRVRSQSGAGIDDLFEIRQTGDEALIVSEVMIDGYVGQIVADTIGDVRSFTGSVFGPITSTGIHNAGKINLVRSDVAGIYADLSSAGVIEFVEAPNGTIGLNAANRVSIQSVQYINRVQALSIYADIEATHATLGDVFRVIATTGMFVGSITASDVEVTTGADRDGTVRGTTGIDADVTLTGDLREPLVVLDGDFAAGRTLTCNDIGDVAISGTGSTQPVYLTIGRFTDSNRTPTSVKRLDVGGFMRARAVGR